MRTEGLQRHAKPSDRQTCQNLVLGTLHLRELPDTEVFSVLDAFFDQGGQRLDVATLYGGMPLLKCIGEYLRVTGVVAEVFVKVGYFEHKDEYHDDRTLFARTEAAIEAIGPSSAAVLLHEADWQVWWRPGSRPCELCTKEDTALIARRLERLQRQARIWGVPLGFAGNNAEVLSMVHAHADAPTLLLVAKQYDLLWRNALPLVRHAQRHGTTLILGAPWHQGWLRDLDRLIYHRPCCASAVRRLRSLSVQAGVAVEDLALSFVTRTAPSALIAFGARSASEVRQAFAAVVWPLPEDILSEIESLGMQMSPMGSLIPFKGNKF